MLNGTHEPHPFGTLLFDHHVNQNHLIDGWAQEVCSHNLSVSPLYVPFLPQSFLYDMEIIFVVDGKIYCDDNKYLKSFAKDNFQLVLVKTVSSSQFTNIESKILSICQGSFASPSSSTCWMLSLEMHFPMAEEGWFLTCYLPLKPSLAMLQPHCHVYQVHQDCIKTCSIPGRAMQVCCSCGCLASLPI